MNTLSDVIIDLIHNARNPCTRLRADGIKAMSRGFFPIQEISVKFVYSWQEKMNNFLYKDDNGKLWVEVIIFTFLDTVATVDVLTASNNDVNFVETQTIHFAWPLNHNLVLRE